MTFLRLMMGVLLVPVLTLQAEEALVEQAGFILDVDRARGALVLGAALSDPAGMSVSITPDTVVYEETPTALPDIIRGTTMAVMGPTNGKRIQVTRITALAVVPKEGRYQDRVIGLLERQDGAHQLIVNDMVYQLILGTRSEVFAHQKVSQNRLRKGQELRIVVQPNKSGLPLARQIIFRASPEELKTEKEEILL